MTDVFDPNSSPPQNGDQTIGQTIPEPRPDVPNHLVKAILATCFCCPPFGVVAIVLAAQVNGKLETGDYAGATSASQQANMYGNISIGLGILPFIGAFVIIVVGLIAQGMY